MNKYKILNFMILGMFLLGFKAHAVNIQPTLSAAIFEGETQARAYAIVNFTGAELASMGNPGGFQATFLDSGNNKWSTSLGGGHLLSTTADGGMQILLISRDFISNSGYIELKHINVYTNNVNTGYLDGNPDMCIRISGTACAASGTPQWYKYNSK